MNFSGSKRNPIVVSSVLLTQLEPDRTALGVRQAAERLRKISRDLRLVPRAIEKNLNEIPTTHADRLKTLMTLQFQKFDDVSLLAG